MIIIGLVLLIGAAVVGLDLIWKNHYTMRSPALFGQTMGIHSAGTFFLLGAITGAVLLLGLALILAGLRRKGSQAKQHRAERKEAKNASRERDKAQKENEQLRRRLDHDDQGAAHDDQGAAHDVRSSGATAADERLR